MDQEIYDKIMEILSNEPDQNGVQNFAQLLSFHYPDQGRALLTILGAIPLLEPPTEVLP